MKLFIFFLFIMLFLSILFFNERENFIVINRIFRAIKKPKNYKELINNTIGDNSLNKMGKKIYVADLLKNKYYYPKTFIIRSIDDFPNKDYLSKNKINFNKIWYVKEAYITGGGSQVIPEIGYNNIKNSTINMLKKFKNGIIVQENIEPYLLDKKKVDLRIFYIMVLYKGKIYFYLQDDCFFRYGTENYDNNSKNKYIHVTNVAKNRKNINMSELKDYKEMMFKLQKCHIDLSRVISNKFDKNYVSKYKIEYQISGNDWIYDNKLEPYLLELNSGSPSYLTYKDTNKMRLLKNNLRKFCENIIDVGINNKKLPTEKYGFILLNL